MTEASHYYDGDLLEGKEDALRVAPSSEFRATPSNLMQSENKATKSTVMVAPRSRKTSKLRKSLEIAENPIWRIRWKKECELALKRGSLVLR